MHDFTVSRPILLSHSKSHFHFHFHFVPQVLLKNIIIYTRKKNIQVMRGRASGFGIRWAMLFIMFLMITPGPHQVGSSMAVGEMVPVVEAETMVMMLNETRRKLGSFQICSLCTCCGGPAKTYCLPTPCCYAINCNIPNRPFGFCSFTPKTCNCFGCRI